MGKIINVNVFLDDNIPEDMDGIIRIGSVEYEYESVDDEHDYNDGEDNIEELDLVNNEEFHTEEELVTYVAEQLGISTDIINVISN